MKKIKCACGSTVEFPDDRAVKCGCGETYMGSYLSMCDDPVILKTSKHGDKFYTKYEEGK